MTQARPGTRAAAKHQAIIDAATEVFLSNGYVGASMDEVAARAAVSKQTVYKHFASKERLFTAIVLGSAGQVEHLVRDSAGALVRSRDLAADLTTLARRFVGYLMQPDVMRLRRLVIAEADRFPAIGRSFYAEGPERVATILGESFAELARGGRLRIDDGTIAAYHFCWLVLAIPWNRVLLAGGGEAPDDDELDRVVRAGVAAFLGAYEVRPRARAVRARSSH